MRCNTHQKVEALADKVIVDVACGDQHTCAVTSTGSIFTWGRRAYLTGHGETGAVLKPNLLQDLSSKGVVNVSVKQSHAACVTKAGEIFTWGHEKYGKLHHQNTMWLGSYHGFDGKWLCVHMGECQGWSTWS